MKISASIVIYNEKEEILKKAIISFLSLKYEKKLIILDNSPTNKMEEFCKSFDNVKYMFAGNNLGFGKGHNLAFKYVGKSDIHLILNPDVYFDFEEINGFLEWFYNNEDIVMALPNVLNPDGSVQKVVRNEISLKNLIKRKLKIDEGTIKPDQNKIMEIPFAHGCFIAVKPEIFKKLQGFDERFFMYMEDVDLWLRAKKYGKTVINTNFYIYHYWRKESSKNFKLLIYHIISLIKFFLKKKD